MTENRRKYREDWRNRRIECRKAFHRLHLHRTVAALHLRINIRFIASFHGKYMAILIV